MDFRLVPKWVILNDLEWRNGRYLAFFHRIRQLWGRLRQSGRKQTYTDCDKNVIPSFQQYIIYGDILRGYRERAHYREAPVRYTPTSRL